MNVYQMYVANGNKAGFSVRRKNWRSSVRVVSVAGLAEGVLPGEPPYYGNPPVIVAYPNGRMQVLSCPGTFQYVLVK